MTTRVQLLIVALLLAIPVFGVAEIAAQEGATPAASPVGTSCEAASSADYLIYQAAGGASDEPRSEVIVVDAAGNELHRVSVPGVLLGAATGLPGRALLTDEEGRVHLLDADAGTVTRLDLPETGKYQLPSPDAKAGRYALLSTVQRDQVSLVDVQTGQTTDLTALTGEAEMLYGVISVDGAHAILNFEGSAYIVPTADPAAFRRLGGEARSGGVVISPDGTRLAYQHEVADDRFELIVESIDGADSRVVATHDQPPDAQFAGTSDRLLVRTIDELIFVDLASGAERQLLEEWVQPWIVSPDGNAVLVHSGEETRSGTQIGDAWVMIEFDTGELRAIDELDQTLSILPPGGSRWVVMASAVFHGFEDSGGGNIYGVDLITGDVRELFAAEPDEEYGMPFVASSDGRYALLRDAKEAGDDRLWLLDLAAGEARIVTEGPAVGFGTISADGCWIAVESMPETEGGRPPSITIVPIAGGEVVTTIDGGNRALWLVRQE